MNKILVIEDDPIIRKGLKICLEEEHYRVDFAEEGNTGLELSRKNVYDLIILDLMLPGINGMEICRRLRSGKVRSRIIILTSKREEADIVLGLELGADDYLTKPFGIRELLARIKALLRRDEPSTGKTEEYEFGKIKINFNSLKALKAGKPLKLTAKEYKLLEYFVEHREEVVTRDMLLDDIWGYDVFPTTRTVDTFILNLRKKIEDDPSNPKYLVTVHKVGYRFIPG